MSQRDDVAGGPVDRRAFLRVGTLSAAVAAAAGGLRAGERAPVPVRADPFELVEATIADLQARMQSGQDTARTIVDKYLARIEALDKHGPALRSILDLNPDAREIADSLDAERKARGPRGPMHGIPVLLKDNIGTADRMTTTAGSLALEGSIPHDDAWVAKQLREAGAILLAKTNLSEWANFRSTHSVSGWSGRGGLARNPYALDRNTSGSSSGSGAATAANLGAVSLGTETDGSIVSPATCNGLVGLKPTIGLVSRTGIIPIAHSQDTAGPMTRTVTDAAILLSAITAADPKDIATRAAARHRAPDYTTFLDKGALKGARLGVVRDRLFGYSTHADRIADAAIADMKRLGAVIVDPANVATVGKLGDDEFEVLLYEFKADLNAYLTALGPGARIHSLKELIEFNEREKDREMPYFGQEILIMAEAKGPLSSKAYLAALARNHQRARAGGIDAVMRRHRLDALVAPTGSPAPMSDLVNGDYGSGGSSALAAIAGYPHITVPAGFALGLPVGISFFGRAWSEPKLLALAYAFEQATNHRRPPGFLPTAPPSSGTGH